MHTVLEELTEYADDHGNRIEYAGPRRGNVRIEFRGANNVVRIAPGARLGRLVISMDCDNGLFSIGTNSGAPSFVANVRIGQDSSVIVGDNTSTTANCVISATEGTTVEIGDDVMIASHVQIRADDAHPIFDVRTGQRVNVSRSITIGDHVWLALGVTVLGGASVGRGSVVGTGSILTSSIPNNCIAVGTPARVVRRDVAWERPHLSLKQPFYKPDASTVERSPFWELTEEPV
ncbi:MULTISPECIES: acyltransferase [unclassified Curtobacterium]|uniref:acyltransferase n=1 Tax=unclassified Curtobacterium TaxID=257496 RepID=UPI0009F4EFA6|nr:MULTISPECIES: acyltransferase [unclassified Curtobacterium]